MQGKQLHLSDEELLLFSDQELPPRSASNVRAHVAQCATCRERLEKLEAASVDFAEVHEEQARLQESHSSQARNLLKARLSEYSTGYRTSRPGAMGIVITRQLASACLALLLVVGVTLAVRRMLQTHTDSDIRTEAIALPSRALTPGSTRTVQIADICGIHDPDNDPPVNPSLEQAVFQEYGVPATSTKNYALDYLITPALGGSDDIRNLWPQPYSSVWNARVKDQLEDHLHELVCQGKVQLTTAQSDIATDWIAAYKRYFNTDKPELSQSTAASVDSKRDVNPSHRRHQPKARISTVYNLALVTSHPIDPI